jgi:hypothetical protein
MNTDVSKQAQSGDRAAPTLAGLALLYLFAFYPCSSVFICG